jgi:nuclear pore complex protein Nup98-Nup96
MFGGAATNTSSGFGNTSGGFGASTGGGFGTAAASGPNNGTAATPFQAFQEKETGSANAQAQYQTITFQQPYQNYSLEELRMADYNQGRRYGNQNGQAGAFGQSTGFGGFGSNTASNASTGFGANANTGGGMFGNTSNTSTSFGGGTSTGFGANNTNTTGGGLFGQNKPAGGLFGSSTTTTGTTGGGLFGGGANTNTGNAFGSGGTGFGASTGGGLFGQNNQAQSKPAFGGFGNTNTANTTTTPFGGSTLGQSNTSGGLFGQQNQTASTGFGNNTQASGTGGGLFGNTGGAFGQTQQNQPQNQTSGGLFGGGSAFGQNNQANQPKPGGLFGNSTTNTTGGGLFGNNNQQQQQQAQPAGGLFGQSKPAGGLFGAAPTNQPAATGGLFGNTGSNTGNTGGSLFGGMNTQNTQQNASGGLFGASNNQQKPGGLFGGSTTANNSGGGLFNSVGQNGNQSTLGGSLFGSQSQQQQNQPAAGNSLFSASGNSLLQTSMTTNPYGNDALFAGLTTPAQSPGPLATPLSSSQKNRKSSIIPQHKLNPSQSTRLLTPQGKRPGGYGFTYSTYGTPTSASSQSSPLSGSLFSPGSLSRSLGKSLSTSNLRNSFTPDTSILAPGAFSTTGRSFGSGSLKKLNINRSINSRPSLFDDPSPPKRVSFAGPSSENDLTNGSTVNGSSSGALVVREEPRDTSPRDSYATPHNGTPNGSSSRPEMQQVNSQELTPVPENGALKPRTSASLNMQNGKPLDPRPGEYYSEPSIEVLKRMTKRQLENVPNFVVGRDKIGKIEFNMGEPVNLSEVPLDKLFGDIVQLNPRNATCYGGTCTVVKPPQGSGLNQLSRITLGNSWPRGQPRPGRKDVKHLERLKRVDGTTFLDYRPETGEWVFTVPHFSSYGFDYDDEEEEEEGEEGEEEEEEESSPLSAIPDTPAQNGSGNQEGSFVSPSESSPDPQSSPDDTFDFKKGVRNRASVPGQFGDQAAYEEDDEMEDTRSESFLGERSVGSLDGQQDYTDESGSEPAGDQNMTGSVSRPVRTTEQVTVKEPRALRESIMPKSILKTSQLLRPTGTPSKGPYVFDDDWANTLQRTISPKKQDRQALRETQTEVLGKRDANPMQLAQSLGRNAKTTMDRMDLMDSLFGETDKRMDSTMKRSGHGMQV